MAGAAILCVDDELMVLQTMELILQKAGYSVSTAATVGDACRLLRSRHIDVLLLDCIPGRNWVIQEARRVNRQMRIAICTGDIGLSDFHSVDMVIHKPAPPPLLLKKLTELLTETEKAA